jgi:hypothetical protein
MNNKYKHLIIKLLINQGYIFNDFFITRKVYNNSFWSTNKSLMFILNNKGKIVDFDVIKHLDLIDWLNLEFIIYNKFHVNSARDLLLTFLII